MNTAAVFLWKLNEQKKIISKVNHQIEYGGQASVVSGLFNKRQQQLGSW